MEAMHMLCMMHNVGKEAYSVYNKGIVGTK